MRRLLEAALRRSGWIKLGLMVIFLTITGLPDLISTMSSLHEEPATSWSERLEDRIQTEMKYRELERVIVERAESLGPRYTPDDYFSDINTLMASPYFGKATFAFSGMDKLMGMMHKNASAREIAEARDRTPRIATASELASNEKFSHFYAEHGLAWLVERYLLCMPLAFSLFLFWLARGVYREEKRFWPSWWRLALALTFYPIVIGWTWHSQLKNKGRGWLAEVVLRQHKKEMAGALSEEEVRDINLFARSRESLSSWRKKLGERGLKPQHSFLAAALVVAVFTLGIRPALVQASVSKLTAPTGIERCCGHTPRDKVEPDSGSSQDGPLTQDWAFPVIDHEPEPTLPLVGPVVVAVNMLRGLARKPPDSVPRLAA